VAQDLIAEFLLPVPRDGKHSNPCSIPKQNETRFHATIICLDWISNSMPRQLETRTPLPGITPSFTTLPGNSLGTSNSTFLDRNGGTLCLLAISPAPPSAWGTTRSPTDYDYERVLSVWSDCQGFVRRPNS